jgi:group I intron endonuclease
MRGIYAIRNAVTGQAYIGSSDNIAQRLSRHQRNLRAGTHPNPRLQRAWIKYGSDAFDFETVCAVSEDDDLLVVEQQHIDAEGDYNIIPAGAVPSFRGGQHAEETKERLRLARTGKVMSDESRARVRAARLGTKSTPDAVEAMRKGLTGQQRTPEQIERYRQAWTPERRARQQAVGAKLQAEDVLKIRERYPAESIKELAETYGVTDECVRRIVRRLSWKNI